jgi:hypothetical protein
MTYYMGRHKQDLAMLYLRYANTFFKKTHMCTNARLLVKRVTLIGVRTWLAGEAAIHIRSDNLSSPSLSQLSRGLARLS